MTLETFKNDLIGVWAGENVLRLSWMTPPEYKSRGELTAAATVREKFLSISYQWSHEDAPHEGLLLVGYDAKGETAHAAWVDSWHSSVKPMSLTGTISDEKVLNLQGSYAVPNHPDWGWRIVIAPAKSTLTVTMYNVSPDGVEDLAVQAIYRRVMQEDFAADAE